MLRSRRFAFAAAALLVGLSACGDSSPRTAAGNSPVVIQLGGASFAGGGVETASADKMMAQMQDITFVFDGDGSAVGATGSAWTLPAGGSPDTARIAKLAQLLGVDGELREIPADQGGGWMIGAADYSTASLTVSADGMVSWWFNAAPPTGSSSVLCAVADPAIDVVPLGTDAVATTDVATTDVATTDVATTDVATTDVAISPPDDSCAVPPPPAHVPDEASALEKAKRLFADMGYDNASYDYEVYADEWGANVTAYLLLDGMRSPISLSVGFGAEGAVTWASGSLATPVPAGEYPLVGVEGGVVRLNDESGQWGSYGGGPMAMSRMEGNANVDAATAQSNVSVPDTVAPAQIVDDTIGGGDAAAVSQVVPCDTATDCGYETPPMEPITVQLTGVKTGLTMIWAADNTIWLLPAYEFSANDGGQYTVIAVDDSFLQLPEAFPTDTMPVGSPPIEPMPAETVPGVDVPAETVVIDEDQVAVEEVGKTLVGLSIADATKVAEAAGMIVRIVEGDGAPLAITDDLRPNRLNVSVRDGVVANIVSIG